jgi:hypothetical protein
VALIWSLTGLLIKRGFWLGINIYLFLLVGVLLRSPVIGGYVIGGYDIGVDTLAFRITELTVWLIFLMILARYQICRNSPSWKGFIFLLNRCC